ncbi:MAG: bifunctional nuclease family protein, partial [Gemmatimonadaceae bacterium]
RRVTITRVEKNTYCAELQIAGPGGVVEVDARPSDSIAIALRLSAPIYAQASLLAELDGDDDEAPDLPATPPEGELTSDQLKAYLERLRPEDFGKFSP